MSTESELQTVFGAGSAVDPGRTILALLEECARQAPSASGQLGLFNGYGRIYLDVGHLELAAAECDSPYALISIINWQQKVLAAAVQQLKQQNIELHLSNCNHSGLLTDTAPTWGSHENYLVQLPPDELADRMLPFLVSRLYTGSGGVHFPSGNFLGGVRLLFLNRDRGGDTMNNRAIHSTARSEHLTSNPARYGYRYHLLLGDGLRSEFCQFLQFGTTAVVVKTLEWEMSNGIDNRNSAAGTVFEPMPTDGERGQSAFWLRALRQFNVLTAPGSPPTFPPLLCRVQRQYLARCDRFHAAHPDLPDWVGQVLAVWDSTLNALERGDYDWLSQRLDIWIKHRLISRFLKELGKCWEDLPNNRELHERLALLNQDYHDICRTDSVFCQLEAQGELRHRVVADITPGDEPEPFVPKTGTRAEARARFIKERAHGSLFSQRIEVDWSTIVDTQTRNVWVLDDPFAAECHEVLPSH